MLNLELLDMKSIIIKFDDFRKLTEYLYLVGASDEVVFEGQEMFDNYYESRRTKDG